MANLSYKELVYMQNKLHSNCKQWQFNLISTQMKEHMQ